MQRTAVDNQRLGDVTYTWLRLARELHPAIMRKLELTSTAALVRYAVRNKQIEP